MECDFLHLQSFLVNRFCGLGFDRKMELIWIVRTSIKNNHLFYFTVLLGINTYSMMQIHVASCITHHKKIKTFNYMIISLWALCHQKLLCTISDLLIYEFRADIRFVLFFSFRSFDFFIALLWEAKNSSKQLKICDKNINLKVSWLEKSVSQNWSVNILHNFSIKRIEQNSIQLITCSLLSIQW